MGRQRLGGTIAAAALATATLAAQPPAAVDVDRPDLLSFAQGAVPVSITGVAAAMRAATEAALRLIDGDPTPFVVVTRRAPTDTPIEIVYQLPAATVFDRFAVPNGCGSVVHGISFAFDSAELRPESDGVVAAPVARGLAAARLKADGAGETRPIADNVDEAGRSLNRRVEVRCTP